MAQKTIETEVKEPTVIEMSQAPSALEERCTRERLISPPDWRYQAAVQYLQDERDGITPTVPSDPFIQYTVRALRGARSAHSNRYLMNMWPVMETVLYYGIAARKSAVAAEIDACLIKGWDAKTACGAGCPVSREVYDLYAAIFFDLTGARLVNSWVQDFLFEPEKYSDSGSALLRARILAYYGDGATGVNVSVMGPGTEAEQKLMRDIAANERQKKLFDYIIKKAHLDPALYAGFMEAAFKSMTDHDFQEKMQAKEHAGSESIDELATGLEDAIRAYSQSEILKANSDGLDFTNQYMKVMAQKEPTNG